MKAFYFTISIIFTAFLAAVAYFNMDSSLTKLNLVFTEVNANPAIVILIIAVVGIFTGAFYYAFLCRALDNPEKFE
ncbi:MAG: hypothetical protein Q8P62_01780 [Candidatus Peregrinibacteria bacterium]|nr:hypothetical protein [Candidatus Peregrinibacteria bacterium]